ncbi:Hsp70 family protein [Colletotrichum higginsianum IMI 349063]|uniref:Hsp70 family protein n=2 Tax=Colletotrichum higginsianum TaxID=80884 RepID=A0A1B7YSP6_COLHI|nr:Hsp70 family protein [Colletotrichum higginsianum IMI 349063]OBR15070.1 Hsp70 family protein [Colletotrichum higginsianum IMI 349063]
MWLFEIVNKIKNVDSKLSDLCKEVEQLTNLLTSVEKTVKQCQSQVLTLAHLDQHMWEQINTTLADCQCNIDGLDRLVMKLMSQYDPEAKAFARLLKKPSLHFHFVVHKDEIQDYTTKIVKSNYAMQTTLAVVSVSLNFRTTVSQEAIFQELERLNKLIQKSFEAAERREVVPDPSSLRQSMNLQSLARAAKRFHTVTTTTASTAYGAGERRPSTIFGGSESGDLTEVRIAEIEQWRKFNQLSVVDESTEDSMTEVSLSSGHRDTSTIITTPDTETFPRGQPKPAKQPAAVVDDSDDDSDVELDFLRNSEELAYERFVSKDYSKAEKFLRMAVERLTGDAAGASNFRQLKLQLALCCCLQDKWNHAAGILDSLPKARPADNLPVLDLLQAISIAHLEEGNLEDAYNTCKTVLQGKKKVFGRESQQYYGCLWLFASIHDKRGPEHALEAETVRHSIPRGWTPTIRDVLSSPKRFILDQEDLVQSIFAGRGGGGGGGQEPQPSPSPAAPQQAVDDESISNSELEARVDFSGHWQTLLLKEPANGLLRAQREEGRGASSIGETDTGKEMVVDTGRDEVVQNVPGITFNLLPDSRRTFNTDNHGPGNQFGGSSAGFPDWRTQHEHLATSQQGLQYTQAMPSLRPVSPKRHHHSRSEEINTPVWRSVIHPTDDSQQLPMRSVSQRLPPTPSVLLENTGGILRSHSQQSRPFSRLDMGAVRSTPDLSSNYNDEVRPDVLNQRTESAPAHLSLGHTKSVNRPVGHSRLIDKVQQAQARSTGVRERPSQATQPSGHGYHQQSYLQSLTQPEAAGGIVEDEFYSTLEVVTPSDTATYANNTAPWSPSSLLSPTSSSGHQLRRFRSNASMQSNSSRRTRWTVQKDIGNIGQPRPSVDQSQFLPLSTSSSNSGLGFVGVSFGVASDGSVAVRTGHDEVSICQMPARPAKHEASVQSPTSGMRGFIRKANMYSSRKPSPLADTSGFTVDSSSPRDLLNDFGTLGDTSRLIPDERELLARQQAATAQIEAEVANILCRGQSIAASGTFNSLRLEALVYVLPDLLDRTSRELWTKALEEAPLLQHAKVIPQSYAIVQYYLLTSGQLALDHTDPSKFETVAVVLNCEEKLVDCTPYSLEAVSGDLVEIHDLQSSYMAEIAGHGHAQAQFAKLVIDQLRIYERELSRKFDAAAIHEIVKSCCDQFNDKILPGFDSDGKDWTVEFEIPSAIPGFQHGRLKFANSEIMRCFMQSVSMIQKMLADTVTQLSTRREYSTHILLAGSYSKSKYLLSRLDNTMRELRQPGFGPVTLLTTAEYDDVCALGALSHAMGC